MATSPPIDPLEGAPPEKRRRLRDVAAIAAGISAVLPGAGKLLGIAPPLLMTNGVLCAAAGAAFVYHALQHPRSIARDLVVRRVAWSMIPAIFIFAIYHSLLGFYTADEIPVATADDDTIIYARVQVGLGTAEWTFKSGAWERIVSNGLEELATEDIIMKFPGAATSPEILWKNWTILVAGMLLVVLYVGCWFLWIRGWCAVIRME